MKKAILAIIIIIISSFFLYPSKEERILNNSILKEQTFTPDISEVTAPKTNIKAYLFKETTNPIIAIDLLFKNSGHAQSHITNFINEAITDNKELQNALEINAIGLSFSSTLDDFAISITTPKKSINKAIELFQKAFYNPQIKNSTINRIKEKLLLAKKRQQENPASKLALSFNKALYKDHPYGKNPLGSNEEIKNTTSKDIKNYIKNSFAKDNIVVSIAGDANQKEAQYIIDKMFINLPSKSKNQAIKKVEMSRINEAIEDKTAQNISIIKTKATTRTSKDFYPLYIANYILGGSGLNSKLGKTIREDKGLVYSIYSYLSINDNSNAIVFSFSTSKENDTLANKLFKEQINNFSISNKELQMAKDSLIASHNLKFASITEIAKFLTYVQKDNLGLDFFAKRNDYINNVTNKKIKEVIKKYYNYTNFNKMTIGEE